jgi:hypothetical protein
MGAERQFESGLNEKQHQKKGGENKKELTGIVGEIASLNARSGRRALLCFCQCSTSDTNMTMLAADFFFSCEWI